jgi:hypothetical protein
MQKTLSMSDMILELFFATLNSNIDWAAQSLPQEITNKNRGKYKLYDSQASPRTGWGKDADRNNYVNPLRGHSPLSLRPTGQNQIPQGNKVRERETHVTHVT